MRAVAAISMALMLCTIPAAAQQRDVKPGSDSARGAEKSSMGSRSMSGTVKKTTDNGLVVVGRETGQKDDKEWAFALDPATRIEAGGKSQSASALREGDAVTVTYTDRDGKVVAQNIKVSAR